MKLLSTILLILGLLLTSFGGYQLYLRENPTKLSFDEYKYTATVNEENKQMPARITISALDIDAPVIPAKMQGDTWPVVDNGVSYLANSPLPGAQGNSVMYAHNWKNLFGNLVNAKTGEEVVMTNADGSKKTFVITGTSIVSPNESSILAPSKDKRITLYTCTGFLDSQRFVAVATLK
jgi:LPXTG-site transpeptidase (sortase) family protein